MCGIAGFVNRDGEPASEGLVRAMIATIEHRGPDDDGVLIDGDVALGHRRLSIIDLVEGGQPLANEDESVWVVFNGEIYNFEDLRRDLVARGHRFRTHSDTEVLVHAYEEHGPDLVDELRGMFAFAIWDKARRSLLLARDRFGKKPLYVAESAGRLAFASEMKALLTLPWVNAGWDADGLDAYLHLGYIAGERTAYAGIRKVLPGTVEVWRADAAVERRQYWLPRAVPLDPMPTYDQACSELVERLEESVRIRLRSDVPLGAFLSGGVDSTCVVALMRMCGVKDLETFSIGFESEAASDVPYAREAARLLGTEHHELIHTADDAQLVTQVLDMFDEPYADSSAIPMFLVSRLARRRVTVALSGDGGDELFAGYSQYRTFRRYQRIDRVPWALQRVGRAVGTAAVRRGARGGRFVRMLAVPPEDRVGAPMLGPRMPWILGALDRRFRGFLAESHSGSRTVPTLPAGATVADRQLLDQRNYHVDDILAKVDRCSMAVSLEARAPLLDHHLADWVNGLPVEYKLRGGETKALLRDAMRRYVPGVPPAVLSRPKKGFGVPLKWMWGPLRDVVEERLRAAPPGLLDERGVARLLAADPGDRNCAVALWVVLNLASWAARHAETPW